MGVADGDEAAEKIAAQVSPPPQPWKFDGAEEGREAPENGNSGESRKRGAGERPFR